MIDGNHNATAVNSSSRRERLLFVSKKFNSVVKESFHAFVSARVSGARGYEKLLVGLLS